MGEAVGDRSRCCSACWSRGWPISATRSARRGSPRSFRVLYASCSTNGISTSSTTCCSSAPPSRSAGCSGRRGDEGTIDRFGPNGSAWVVALGSRVAGAAAVGICLHLCVRHADRPDRRGHLGDHAMSGFPILSMMLAVPAVAAVACLFVERERRALARAGRDAGRSRARHRAVGQFDIGGPQWQFVENAPLFGSFAWALGIDGFALMLIMLTRVPDADLHRRELGRDREARARIYGGVPADRSADDRHLRRAGPVPVLHLLRRPA